MKRLGSIAAGIALGALAAAAGVTPAWLAYPGTREPAQETCIVNRTCLSRIAFDCADAPERVRDYYRCLFAATGWAAAGDAGASWRLDDVTVSVAAEPLGPRRSRVLITVRFPVAEAPRLGLPDGILPPHARTLASGVYGGGRSYALVECSDPPAVFLRRAERALDAAGWARHSGLELYRAHGVDESRLGWFARRDGQLMILAQAGGNGRWQYSLISVIRNGKE